MSTSSLSLTTPSPSQSPSFFSKFLRRSEPKGKAKTGPAAHKDSGQVSKTVIPFVVMISLSFDMYAVLKLAPTDSECSPMNLFMVGHSIFKIT